MRLSRKPLPDTDPCNGVCALHAYPAAEECFELAMSGGSPRLTTLFTGTSSTPARKQADGRRKSSGLKLNGMDDTEKQETIAKATARLAARYPDAPRPLIAGLVAQEYELLDAGRIRTYIPTLVENGVRNRLRKFTAQNENA